MYRCIGRMALLVLVAAMSWTSLAETPADATLTDLRRQLDRIRASSSERPEGFVGVVPDLKPLFNLDRTRIYAALGNPNYCYNKNRDDRLASCLNARVVYYAFVKLPPGWAGGGLELVIVFDRNRVRYAVWEKSA